MTAPRDIGTELSFADSSYYDKYQFQPYNPAELWQKKGGYRVFDQMREDDQISSALTLKKLIVLASGWEIESDDEKAQEFLEWNLRSYINDIFDKKLFQILSAIDYGFSLSEKLWEWCEYEGKARIGLRDIKTRAPHTFELHLDKQGNLENILQHTGIRNDILLGPDKFAKFILYSYNAEFDNPYGKSDLDTGIYRAWWSKNAIIKFWNIYLERCGVPPAIATIPRSAGAAEKNMLLRMLDNMQAKTAFIIPEDFKLEMMQVTKGTSDFEAAINKYDSMIARKMLLPDLLGFSGHQTGGGSYALGKEQFALFYATIEYVRQDIQNLVNREIINPLVMWNFGTGINAKFKFRKVDDEKKSEYVQTWLEALRTGQIPTTKTQINWFLQSINAPEITEEEFAEMEQEKEERKEQMDEQLEGKDGEEPEAEEAGGEEAEAEEEEKDESLVSRDELASEVKEHAKLELSREYTVYEKKVNFKQINDDYIELTDKWKEILAHDFKLSINRLMDEVKRKKIVENKRMSLINGLQFPYRSKIKNDFKNLMREALQRGNASAETQKNFVIDVPTGLDYEDVIQWMEDNAEYLASVEVDEILKHIKGTLFDSIRAGNSLRDTMTMIDDALIGYGISLDAPRLENIVRTTVAKAMNEARLLQFNALGDGIVAYQYSAIMDDRTSPLCRALDEKIFSKQEAGYYNPPKHYQCRSIIIPIFPDEEFDGYSKMPATEQDKGGFLTLTKEA